MALDLTYDPNWRPEGGLDLSYDPNWKPKESGIIDTIRQGVGDIGLKLNVGTTVAIPEQVVGINDLARKTTPLGMLSEAITPEFVKKARGGVEDASRKALNDRRDDLSAEMSPAQQVADKKQYFTDDASWSNIAKDGITAVPGKVADLAADGKLFGEGWGDWRKVTGSAAESLPGTVATMGPTFKVAGTAYEQAFAQTLAKTGSEVAAKAAATKASERAAMLAGGAAEGLQGAGGANESTRRSVMEMPADKLEQSPFYQEELKSNGGDVAAARVKAADAAATMSAGIAFLFDATLGALGDKYIGSAAAGKGTRAGAVARGTAQEMPTEFVQSGGEKFGENLGVREFADPSQLLMAGVGEEATAGGLSGGLTGGAMGGGLHRNRAEPATASPPQLPDTGPLSRSANIALATQATTQQPAPDVLQQSAAGSVDSHYQRLAELDLLAEQRSLTPSEIDEANGLQSAIEQGDGNARESLPESDQQTQGAATQPSADVAAGATPQDEVVASATDPVMAAKTDKQLKNLSGPGHSKNTREAATTEIARRAAKLSESNTNAAQVEPMAAQAPQANDAQVAVESGAAQSVEGLTPGTPEYNAAFERVANENQAKRDEANREQTKSDNKAAVDKKNGWRQNLLNWFNGSSHGDSITTDIEGEQYQVIEKTATRNGKQIKQKLLVEKNGSGEGRDKVIIEFRDGTVHQVPNVNQGIDEFAGNSAQPETDIDSKGAQLEKLMEEGIAKTSSQQESPKSTSRQQHKSDQRNRDDLVGAILRVTGGKGVAANMAQTITGDKAGSANAKVRGLFTNDGVADLGDTATLLRTEEGYDIRDGNHLSELIRQQAGGDPVYSMSRVEREAASAAEKQHRDDIRQQANKLGVKQVARPFSDIEQEVIDLLEQRHDDAVSKLDARAKSRFDAMLKHAMEVADFDEVDAIIADAQSRYSGRQFFTEATKQLRGYIDDLTIERQAKEQENAGEEDYGTTVEPDWIGPGTENTGLGSAASAAPEGAQAAEGNPAVHAEEVAPLRLEGQTNEQAAEQFARQQSGEPTELTKEQADKERDAVPFSLDRESQPKPQGMQGGLFTADGRVATDATADSEKAAEAKSTKPIEDFGEKLGSAKKDRMPSMDVSLSDDDIAAQPLSKIWPASEIDAIEDPFIAAVASAARAEIPAKPRVSYKVARWVEKVKTVRNLAQRILDGSITKDRFSAVMKSMRGLDGFAAKVSLLEAIDRKHWGRIGDVREYPDAYRYGENNEHIPAPSVLIDIDGKHRRFDGAKSVADIIEQMLEVLGDASPAKKMQFEVRGRGESFSINKKGDREYRKLKTFTNTKEAFAFIKDHHDELLSAWEAVKQSDNVKETDVRNQENRPRTAQDWRQGKDVTPDQFAETFGFRGVEWGNWVSQGKNDKERQGMLNQAFDAMMDLADIVGIPPKAISLNGSLGLGFGSRGSGWASAHFEPSNLVINLTKMRGAGTFAHEWFHALDNYFSRQRGGEVKIERGLGAQESYRAKNYITYRPEPMYVHKSGRSAPMTKAQLERNRKENPSSGYFKAENWQLDPDHPQGVRPEVERVFTELVEALDASPMLARARKNDKGRDDYWSRIIERGARSFENYVISKMMEKGYNNDYLANVREVQDFPRAKERYPYLLPEEVAPIAEAFDNLFSTVQTKETERGVAMFSRADASAMETAQRRMEKFVDAYLAGDLKEGNNQLLGETPTVIQAIGKPNLQIEIDYATINKVLSGKHRLDISADTIKQLPNGIYDPAAVFVQDNGGVLMITNLVAETGNPVAIAIHFRVDGNRMKVNRIASVFEYNRFVTRISEQAKNLRYVKNEKALVASTTPDTPNWSEVVQKAQELGFNVLTESDIVNLYGSRYSRGSGNEMAIRDLKAVAARVSKGMKNMPPVHVLEDPSYAPESLRDFIQKAGAWDDVEGASHEGEIYLFASGLANEERAEFVLATHEITHYGLRGTIGSKNLDAALSHVWTHNAVIRKKAAALRDRLGMNSNVGATEEVLADMTDAELVKLKGWRNVVRAVRDWLQSAGFEKLAAKLDGWISAGMSDQQKADLFVSNMVRNAREWVRNGKPARGYDPGTTMLGRDEAQFSLASGSKISPADKAIYGMAAEGKSTAEVLTFIASASRSTFNRQVAKVMLKTGISPNITVGDAKGWKFNAGEGKYAAAYNPKTDTVALFRPASAERNMVHELIHAATLKALEKNGVHSQNMKALYAFVKRSGKLKGMYGMADVDEFVAESFSNPKFQAALKGIDAPRIGNSPAKNAWAWFIRNVRSILGLKVDSHDALSRALDIGLGVMRENMRLSGDAGGAVRHNVINDQWTAGKAKFAELTSPEAMNTLVYNFQNKYVDLKNLQERIKQIGGTLTDMNDAYLGEEMYHGKVMKKTADFLDAELRPLLQQLFNTGIKKEDFENFLHARHAPEANKALAERNPTQAMIDAGKQGAETSLKDLRVQLQKAQAQGAATKSIEQAIEKAQDEKAKWSGAQAFQGTEEERLSLSGMSDAAAAQVMAAIPAGKRNAMDSAAAKVDAIQAKTLGELEKYGLMDKASLDAWRKEYQHYIPLHRDEAHPDSTSHPVGQGFSVKGDAAKRRTGSNEKVTNILGHIAMQREAAITRGEKNSVSKRLWLQASQNPDKDFWVVDRPPMLKTIDQRTGFVRSQVDPMYKNKPNVLMVRIAGRDAAIVFNEHNPEAVRLAEALKNLDGQDLDIVERTIGKATRWFAAVNTQYNPIFGIINLIRDGQSGILNLTSTALGDKKGEVARQIPAALKAIYQVERGGQPNNAAMAALWKEFQSVGGKTGYRDLYASPEDRVKALDKELKALERGNLSKRLHAVADWLSDYNTVMENGVRLAAYKVAIDQGMNKERAASLAKNLTVNFNRKGAKAAKLGAFYAFFNASVQGTERLGKTMTGPAGRKIVMAGVALGVLQQVMGMLFMAGDDGDDEWDKIPDFVKERSLIIPVGGGKFISIPMPLGFNVLPNIGRLFTEWALGGNNKPTGKQIGKLMNVVIGSFNPLGGSDAVDMISPTVADPVIALLRNKDWTGKPIYREDMSGLDPTPGGTRTKDSATPWSKGISYVINWASGGTDYQPGAWSPTPDQIDYVIGQVTGGVGREAGKLAQTAMAVTGLSNDELPVHKVPLVGRLVGSTNGPSGQSEKFYENIRELNGIEREIKGRVKDGKDLDSYFDAEPKASMVGVGNAAESSVRKLREQRRMLSKEGDSAGAKEMDGMIATIMNGLNMEMRDAAK